MNRLNLSFQKIEDANVVKAMDMVRETFMATADQMEMLLSDSRETSLTFTKLEEALMWAIKSLAVNGAKAQ